MKGKLTLRAIDKYEPYDCNLFMGKEPFDYELEIFTDLTKPYSKLMSSIKDLNDSIDISISINDEPEIIEFYKNCQKHKQKLFENIEYVEIDYNIKSIIKYLKANPCLKNKKIIINDVPEFSLEIINEINNNLTDTSNLYINVEGNYNLISFKEYSEFILTINNIIADVKKYNFSVFETIMYVYDIVRDKVYQEVSPSEDKHISRNVTTSLMGDKIVCLGYANIFKYILNKLGIDCQVVFLLENDKEGGHARNEIYIKDSKYNIDGVYYFDPTWDRKKNSNSNYYLASYRYFALTKDEIDKEDVNRKYDFYNDLLPAYSPNLLDEFDEALSNNGANMSEDLIKTINHMSMLIDKFSLISKHFFSLDFPDFLKPNLDDIKSKLKKLITFFEKQLTADIYIQALYNVRKIEYYKNPAKYPFTFKDFYRILVNSKWQFTHEDIKKKLLYTLLSDDKRLIMDLDDLENYFKENNLNRSMQYLRLTRTLKTIYEKKENNN